MKAEELMIDDWVLLGGTHSIKVSKLSQYGEYNDIKPIPLTKEILKKNGFRQVMFDFVLDMMHIRRDENVECFYIVVGGKGTRIDYVHEFQHALKLCGIDKEIVL